MSSPEQSMVNKILDGARIDAARQLIRETRVRDEVIEYVQRLIHATRENDLLDVGASPRSGLMLLMAAKSFARFAGRDYVTPDDVKYSLLPALRHRVVLTPTAELEGTTSDNVLAEIMEAVEVPR
jgi:MoxR-like ATPase